MDDEEVCRICRGSEKPLFHPCKCSGSIRFVHEKCLTRWVKQSGSTKFYKKDKSQKCSCEYLKGFFSLLLASFATYIKFALGLVTWLLFIPMVSVKILQIHIVHSIAEIPSILMSWNWIDIVFGLGIVALFLLGSVIVTSFADFMADLERQDLVIDGQPPIPPILEAEQRVEPVLDDAAVDPVDDDMDDDWQELFGMNAGIRNMAYTLFLVIFMILLSTVSLVFIPNLVGRFMHLYMYSTMIPESKLLDLSDYFITLKVDVSILKTLGMGYAFLFGFLGMTSYLFNLIFPNQLSQSVIKVLYHIYTFCKLALFVIIQFLLTPCYLGVAMDFFTMDFFAKKNVDMWIRFGKEPLLFFMIHWFLGMIILFQIAFSFRTLRQFLRPQVLWFLNNPDDPQFSFLREVIRNGLFGQLRRSAMTWLLFGTLILAFARTPLKLSKALMPSLFPIHFGMANPFIQSTVDIILFYLFTFGVEQINPFQTMKRFYRGGLEMVGGLLDLNDYLFPEREMRKPSMFYLRILYLIMLVWMMGVLVIAGFVLIPLFIGSTLINFTGINLEHGIYTHIVGTYVMVAFTIMCKYLYNHLALNYMELIKKIGKIIVNVVSLTMFVGILPFVFGMFFLCVFVLPFIPIESTIMLNWQETWSLGMLWVGFYFRALINIPFDDFADMRNEMDAVHQNGFFGLDVARLFKNVLFPLIYSMGLFILVPYIVTFGALPLLFDLTLFQIYAVAHYVYLVLFCLLGSVWVTNKLYRLYISVHMNILERNNVIVRRLQNIEE